MTIQANISLFPFALIRLLDQMSNLSLEEAYEVSNKLTGFYPPDQVSAKLLLVIATLENDPNSDDKIKGLLNPECALKEKLYVCRHLLRWHLKTIYDDMNASLLCIHPVNKTVPIKRPSLIDKLRKIPATRENLFHQLISNWDYTLISKLKKIHQLELQQ
jgi:hypothetical protein